MTLIPRPLNSAANTGELFCGHSSSLAHFQIINLANAPDRRSYVPLRFAVSSAASSAASPDSGGTMFKLANASDLGPPYLPLSFAVSCAASSAASPDSGGSNCA
jgi:hypothetical protein